MHLPVSKRSQKMGLPPGSFVYVGVPETRPVKINVIDYSENHYETRPLLSIDDALGYKNTQTTTWIDIDGLHQVEILQWLSENYDIHPLVIEDILNTSQRPKIDIFDNYMLLIMKMVRYQEGELDVEQISMILINNVLITFQEKEGDLFDPIRKRIENGLGRIRKNGADYLAYAIMDVIVDHYFLILEQLGEEIEEFEESVLQEADRAMIQELHCLKTNLIHLRKTIFPLREVVAALHQGDTPLLKEPTLRFVKDLYDHTVQIIDAIETNRELVAGTLDLYLSMVSIKMNEVMKVLTVIATIFIPLSFLAGIYGMNFDTSASPFNMPELSLPYGYLLFWGLTLCIAGGFLIFFRRKNWL